jgi:FkbM family methyltransferase
MDKRHFSLEGLVMNKNVQSLAQLTAFKRYLKSNAPALSNLLNRLMNKNSVAEKGFHPFSSLPLRATDVRLVIDIGAYQGDYSYKALRLYPKARVISFEPSPDNSARFHSSILANREFADRVTLYQAAVSDSSGRATLNLTSYGPANSLERQAGEHRRQNPHVYEVGTCEVKTLRLDDIQLGADWVDVIKIDVEGHELRVLEGGVNTLNRTRFVIVEISLARDEGVDSQGVFEIFAFMNMRGFHLYSIVDTYLFDTPGEHLGLSQFDAIFKKIAAE